MIVSFDYRFCPGNGRCTAPMIAAVEYQIPVTAGQVSVQFATGGGGPLSAAGQDDILTRSVLQLAYQILGLRSDLAVDDLTLSACGAEAASATLTSQWLLGCGLLEDNRLSITRQAGGPAGPNERVGAYFRAIAHGLDLVNATGVHGLVPPAA